MNDIQQDTSVSRPRWDGSRVMFEIEDAGQSVTCAISRGALQDLSERRYFKSAELLRCFTESRGRIEAIARNKLRAMPESASGVVSIWADDVDEPPESAPEAVLPVIPA